MKIILFTSFGGSFLPKEITDKLKDGEDFRVRMAEEVDKLPFVSEPYEGFISSDKTYLRSSNAPNIIYSKSEDGRLVSRAKIESVDTSKPWRIVDYDGVESIEYFNGVTVINADTNECEW